jgi:PST family polysaccharide transporter
MSGRAAAAGMSWLAGSRLVLMALGLLAMMVLGRLLSPADFGVMSAAMAVIALASALFEGAFGINIVRQTDLSDRQIAATFWLSAALGVVMFVAIILAAPAVERFFGFPDLSYVLVASAFIVLFKSVGSVSQSLLQRRQRFRTIAQTAVLSYIGGSFFVGISMALTGYGVWALVAGAVLSTALESVTNLVCARVPLRPLPDRASSGEVLRFSGWFTLSQVLAWAANAGANAVTGRTLGAEALGVYSRGWKLLDILVAASAQPMQRVLLPGFSRLHDDRASAGRAFVKALTLSVCAFAVISVMAISHAQAIVLIALGPQWERTVPVVQLLFLALVPRCCFKVSEAFAFALGRSLSATIRQAIYAVLMVGGAILGSRYGAVGVAAATCLAIWIFYLVSLGQVVAMGAISSRKLLVVHLRGLALTTPAAIADLLVLYASPANFWLDQFLGASIGVTVLLLAYLVVPGVLLGSALNEMRSAVWLHVKRRTREVLA